jgi:DNA-binding response OmpR family regulator
MSSKSLHILMVDDDEEDYMIIREMLRETRANDNSEIVWAANFSQANEKLLTQPWDAILVDYDLGTENGLDFIRSVKCSDLHAPMIMVTGRGRYEIDVQAMEAGAEDYITKDALNPTLLERVVRYTIERHQEEDKLESLVEERTQELKQALEESRVVEEELREQNEVYIQANEEQKFDQLMSLVLPVATLISDQAGRILRANNDASVLFNIDKERIIGKLLSSFLLPEETFLFFKKLLHMKPRKKLKTIFLHFREKNDHRLYSFSARHYFDGSGKEMIQWVIHPCEED